MESNSLSETRPWPKTASQAEHGIVYLLEVSGVCMKSMSRYAGKLFGGVFTTPVCKGVGKACRNGRRNGA